MRAIIYRLPTMCRELGQVLCTLYRIYSSNSSARQALSLQFYKAGNRFRSAICFKSPSCSNRGLSDSPSPCSLGSTPRTLCVFITNLGISLGSSLWVQDKTEEAVWDFDVAGVASGKQERGVPIFPVIPMFLLFWDCSERTNSSQHNPSSSVLACSL